MYKNMKKFVVSALCSVALADLFTTQVSAYNNEAHEANVYHDETTDFLEEYGWYPEEETADDIDDLSEEDIDDVEDVENLPNIDTNHVEYDTVEVLDDNIINGTTDEVAALEVPHMDETNEQVDEMDDEFFDDWDELNT